MRVFQRAYAAWHPNPHAWEIQRTRFKGLALMLSGCLFVKGRAVA